MARVHELSRAEARRIAVRAQLPTMDRPTDLVDTVGRLSLVQVEPTNAVAPSAELVLWSRLGRGFSAQQLWVAVDEQRLFELHQTLRVPEDVALLRAEMAEWPGSGNFGPGRRRSATGLPPTTTAGARSSSGSGRTVRCR